MEFSGAQCPFPTLSCGMRVGGLRESSKHRRSFMQPSYGHRDQCFLAVIRGFLLRRAQSIFWGHEWESCMWGNGRSNDHDELRAAECQFLFFLPTCGIITRYHTSSPPSKNKQSPGGLLFMWSNGEPPLEYRPPGRTGTRQPRSFQVQCDRRRRLWWWEWKWVPSNRTVRVPMRGLRGGREPEV